MKNLFLKACINCNLVLENIANKTLNKMSPKARTYTARVSQGLMLGGLAGLVAADANMILSATDLMGLENFAMAQEAKGLGLVAQNLIQGTAQPVIEGGKYVAYGGGLVGVASGLNKFVQMSKQQSQTSAKEAFAHLGAGAGLLGLGWISGEALNSMGDGATQGNTINFKAG